MEQRRCFGCMELTEQAVCPRCGWGAEQNNEPHQLPVGTILAGKYQVGRVLGQGGFGITYLGWDLNLDIRVCIKEFFPASAVNRDHSRTSAVTCNTTHLEAGYASSRERFLREAKSMAKFRDVPQIVSIFDFFQANNTAYMVMQYIEGIDLAKYVRKRGGRIAMDETLRILKPVMEALSLVHKAGLIHRDIAPDNIMLHPRDGAKLMDFGAVRQVDNPDADGELTRSTEAILKNGFAPMEQYQSRGSLGPWTDVYALSATIYYCVTGRIPTEALTRMIEETPLDWSGAEGITQRQIEVLEQGMAIRAKNRIQSVEELMEVLYAPGKPEPQPAPKPSSKRGPELKHDPPRKPPRIPQSKTEPQGESLPDTTPETAPAATPQAMPETVPAAVSKATPEPAPAENAVKTELITDFKVTIPRPEPKQEPEPRPEPEPRQEPVQQPAPEPKQIPEPEGNSLSEKKRHIPKKGVMAASAILMMVLCALGAYGWLHCWFGHIWSEASCTSPKTCTRCGAQEGDVLPHQWNYGTYTSSKTCAVCGETTKLTYVEWLKQKKAQNLAVCGETTGEPLPHIWSGIDENTATCTRCSIMKHTMVSSDYIGNVESEQKPKTFIWGQSVYRRQDVTSIMFSGDISAAPDKAWDVSAARDGSILAWMSNGCLMIASDGIIGANPDCSSLFADFINLKRVDFGKQFDTSDVTNMNAMFGGCTSLPELDLSSFSTSKVTDMGGMFNDCYELEAVDVSSFDTTNVRYIQWMFGRNLKLSSVDVSDFNTANVIEMECMFYWCENLASIDVSGFITSNVKDISGMFEGCNHLKNIQIDSFDVGKVMYYQGFLPDGATVNNTPWREYFEK